MTELPPELLADLETKEKAQMKHQWMYSFMPVENVVYLVGYCKVCDTGVSSLLPCQSSFVVTWDMNIPKWGCIPKQEL